MKRLPYPFPLCSEAFLGTVPVMPAWLFQALSLWRRVRALAKALLPHPRLTGAGERLGLRLHDRLPASFL